MSPQTSPAKAARRAKSSGFTDEERAAMREHVRELKAAKTGKVDGEADVLAKIAEMADADRALAEGVHAIVKEAAPDLAARTWYGMPAYAKDGKVLCHFKPAGKFKMRYATFGFSDTAKLDDGAMWPTEFALKKLTGVEQKRIRALLKKAVG